MNELRVLIFPPSRRDGEVTADVLTRAGLTCAVLYRAPEVAREIDAGTGVLIMTDAALAAPGMDLVVESLSRQPSWSDLAVVVLCQAGPQAPAVGRMLRDLTNVTVLDRPTSARTLVSTVQAALRGRCKRSNNHVLPVLI